MRVIELDARNWKQNSDFYDALLGAIGAPQWHGRVPMALADSMIGGGGIGVNELKPPYAIQIINVATLPEIVRREVVKAATMIQETRERRRLRTGEDVAVTLHLTDGSSN
jgi:hypothetical protein